MSRTVLVALRAILCLNTVLAVVAAPPAAAQGLGGLLKKKLKEKIEQATERAADRAADKAEEVIRCAIGDAACVDRAQAEGKRVVLVDEGAESATPGGGARAPTPVPSAAPPPTADTTIGGSAGASHCAPTDTKCIETVKDLAKPAFPDSAFWSSWKIDPRLLDRFEKALAAALRDEDYLKAGKYSDGSILVVDWMRVLPVFTQEHLCPQSSRVENSVRSRYGSRMDPPPQVYSPAELETVRPRCGSLAGAIEAVLTNKAF
jgi:hypothetical protein